MQKQVWKLQDELEELKKKAQKGQKDDRTKIIFTKKKATEIVGTLGHSSKMGNDVNNFGISVQNCGIGSKLHKCKGSVCENCYAYDGNYNYPSVQNPMLKGQKIQKFKIGKRGYMVWFS